jgi:transcription elongation factor Elf1
MHEGEKISWRKYGRKNRKQRRLYYRQFYEAHKEEITKRISLYQQSPAGKQAQHNSGINQRQKSPEKYQARYKVKLALHNGLLTKLPCQFCGIKKVEAHHLDYSKPLDIIWLCSNCHKLLHKELKKEKEIKIFYNFVDTDYEVVSEDGELVDKQG